MEPGKQVERQPVSFLRLVRVVKRSIDGCQARIGLGYLWPHSWIGAILLPEVFQELQGIFQDFSANGFHLGIPGQLLRAERCEHPIHRV